MKQMAGLKLTKDKQDKIFAIALVVPALLMLSITIFYPLMKVIIMSFFSNSLLNMGDVKWNSFQNYKSLFIDKEFIPTFLRTLYYVFGTVLISFFAGLGIAILLNKKNLKGKNIFRGILFLPWTVPALVVAVVWMWMFQPQYGVLNYIGTSLGIIKENVNWLGGMNTAMPAVIVTAAWRDMPLIMVMLLAAFQTVPEDLVEAAKIDGANSFQNFMNVTLPCSMSVIKTVTLTAIISNFQMFVYFFNMTGGGPINTTTTLTFYTYNTAFSQFDLGKGAAIGVIWLLFLVVFSTGYNKLLSKKEIN